MGPHSVIPDRPLCWGALVVIITVLAIMVYLSYLSVHMVYFTKTYHKKI